MPKTAGLIGTGPTLSLASNFSGGNATSSDVLAFCRSMVIPEKASGRWSLYEVYERRLSNVWVGAVPSNVNPVAGGTLSLDSVSLGSYDYTIKHGSQTLSSFTDTDWFTSTQDTRSAFIYVNGNLTINAGVTFVPSARKLFTVLYVNGNLTLNGTVSMTARGASHAGTSKGNIKLVPSGTYSAVANPVVPADGGSGAAGIGRTNGSFTGSNGTAGSSGGTGGGGTGGVRENNNAGVVTPGSGAGGTSFSGGGGGGGAWFTSTASAGSATANGGQGGSGITSGGASAFGGAGNPAGTNSGSLTPVAGTGTGGVLIIFVEGVLSGSGIIEANGVQGSYYSGASTLGTAGGGGSGGGSVTVFYRTDTSTITPVANGGAGGTLTGNCSSGFCPGGSGGAGGAGTARKLAF